MATRYSKYLVKRGLLKDMPNLHESELGYALDAKTLYIGSNEGNIPLTGNHDIVYDGMDFTDDSPVECIMEGGSF